MGADHEAAFFDGDGVVVLVGPDRHHVGFAPQIYAVRQQVPQRGRRQRIGVAGVELAVAHHHEGAIGDDVDRARRVIFEPHLAGLLDVEFAFRLAPVRPDLHEIADHALDRRKVETHAVDEGVLAGLGRDRFGRLGRCRRPGRIGQDRDRRLCRGHRPFRRGLWDRHGLGRRDYRRSQEQHPDQSGYPRPSHVHLRSPVQCLTELAPPYGLFTTQPAQGPI